MTPTNGTRKSRMTPSTMSANAAPIIKI
jgi:hypothetical protein